MTTSSGRRLPRPRELAPLIGRRSEGLSPTQARLERCATIADLRALARRRVPRPVFDYVDGAAGSEASLRRARATFDRVEFSPRVLRDVREVDLSMTMLGQRSALPFALAPTGFTRMMHHLGEPAVAAVAGEVGIPYALSTLGTTSVEDLAARVPGARRWFQLYVQPDRGAAADLVHRAAAAGYDALIVTVDAPVGGIRPREVRNGLTIPPRLSAGTLMQLAMRPRWWWDVVTTEPLTFASLSSTDGTVGDLLTRVFDAAVVPEDITWLRGLWPGSLVLKGIQSVEDAVLAADLGVDAVVLSNHGGRQLDMGGVPLELLPAVRDEVGERIEVILDGGILRGSDIVAALAWGATGVLVGRAYLYGLMAGGADGVRRAVAILEKEVRTTFQLLGVTSSSGLTDGTVRLRSR